MDDGDMLELKYQVGRHESDLDQQLNKILALEKEIAVLKQDVRDLLVMSRHFFVWQSSTRRFSDAQETAYAQVIKLLQQMENRHSIPPL
jgi:hypothetical protein